MRKANGKYANCCEHDVLRDRYPYKAALAEYAMAWQSQKAWKTDNESLNGLIRLEDRPRGTVFSSPLHPSSIGMR
jgi:hypothetical protein